MNIVPKMNDKEEGKGIPHVYKRRILDSKDIDFIVQYYVQNLNKQHHVYEKKKTRKKKLVFFSCIAAVLLIFAAYNASVRLSSYMHESGVKSTQKLPVRSETLPSLVSEKPNTTQKNRGGTKQNKTPAKTEQVKHTKQHTEPKTAQPQKTAKQETAPKNTVVQIKTKQQSAPVKAKTTPGKKRIKQKTARNNTPVQTDKKIKKAAAVKQKKSQKIKAVQVRKKANVKNEKRQIAAQAMATSPGITLTDMVMCEGVKSLKPVGAAESFSSRRVYCWVRLKSKGIPYKVNFTFYHGGKWIYRYTTTIKRKNAVTWCYKTIWEKGEWRVRLTDENENLIGYKTFMHD